MHHSAYKLAHIDRRKILSVARQALISANRHYYSLSTEEQEKFRATMSDLPRNVIRKILLKNLLNIESTDKTSNDIWNELPISDLNELNWASLLTCGIGDDFIFLNESLANGKTLLDFTTLYDYNYADYLFQEQAKKRDFKEYQGEDYYAYKHPSWVRLLINEDFYYASFSSLATFLCDEVDSAGSEVIKQLIPHDYVESKDHGKKEEHGFLWDMQIDANGMEEQLTELQTRWHIYQQKNWIRLSKNHTQSPPCVYTQDDNLDNDPHLTFIFNNESSLKQISWKYFLTDCEPLMAEFSTVEQLIDEEVAKAKSWLHKSHQDIVNNFDPKVTKLRKKRKVIMSDKVIDDLQNIKSSDNEI